VFSFSSTTQFVEPLPPLELPDVNILVAAKYIQIT